MNKRNTSSVFVDREAGKFFDPSSSSRENVSPGLASPPANGTADFRHQLGRAFDFSGLMFKPNGQEFFTLGRMNGFKPAQPNGTLAPEKRALIAERINIEEAGGEWKRYDEVGLTPQDMMALINEGTQTPAPDLSRQIDLWWKERENDPLWQKPDRHEAAPSAQQAYDLEKHRRRIQHLVNALQIPEREIPRLLRFDQFSRGTVYVRDYAAIPRVLRHLFKMVPYGICTPANRDELMQFVQYAAKHKIPLTPRGRGTWALGGALATKGGLILDLANFEKTIVIDPINKLATVSCAVDFQSLEEELQHHGLTLLVRPSNKYANIGGFCSVGDPGKGGAGLFAFAHGHIGNVVEKLEVVTGVGEVKEISQNDPAMADFLGTNGRNGIITKITLRVGEARRVKGEEREASEFPVAVSFSSFRHVLNFAKKLRDEVSAHDVAFHPLHVEAFSASYLKALLVAESTAQHALPISDNGQIADNHEPRTSDFGLRTTNNGLPERDSLLVVFASAQECRDFENYALKFGNGIIIDHHGGHVLWEERFQPLKLRRRGDLLTSEVMLPLESVADYLEEVTSLADKLGVELLPICYIMDNGEALVIPQFLTDRRQRLQYYRHFSLVPVLARRAIKQYRGRPYGFGLWMAGLFKLAMGKSAGRKLQVAKQKYDPHGVLNPGKLTEIRSRFFNLAGNLLLNRFSVAALDIALRAQSLFGKFGFVRNNVLKTVTPGYAREKFDALHRCIKCSACFVCPLAQVWQKSGDPKLQRDAIYITPRFKMEYMQRHLFEGKKLSQEDVDRFALCLRCGIAEREHVCPISDMLLDVKPEGESKLVQIQRPLESTPCKKEFPTYDAFEDLLRQEGYDVDGAIKRYMDILKTHPGVARAMQDVLGKYRVPKNGDLVVLKPKTDFAIYKVEVDQDRCINCGKCGDEHTTSQRGFWDPRHPRKMVSLDDLIRELEGKLPLTWFRDMGGPIPDFLKTQGVAHKGYLQLPPPNQLDLGHQHCNGCLYCVIECPVDAIRVHINPYFENLGGRDFSRDDVRRINEESRNGDVPTSGTGSTGLFGGKGFDRYMFDFSVIVRPTRDGIREAIDINVNLGRKPLFHLFTKNHVAQASSLPGRQDVCATFPASSLPGRNDVYATFPASSLPGRQDVCATFPASSLLGRQDVCATFPASSLPGRQDVCATFQEHLTTSFSTIDLATPIVLEFPSIAAASPEKLAGVFARAASREKTLCLMTLPEFAANFEKVKYFAANIGLKISAEDIPIFEHIQHATNAAEVLATLQKIPLVLLRDDDAPADLDAHDTKLALLREIFSPGVHLGVWMNIPAGHDHKAIANKTLELARAGVGIIYLKCAWNDELGYYDSADVLPEVYDHLYKNAAHSQVTLLANGIKSPADLGVALMLGASAGVIDRATVVAMNHEFPMLEKDGQALPDFDEDAGLQRVQNLFKSWHKQIREVLGAFGVRDIRRTVGERGRLIDLRERAKIMQSIVTDAALREKSKKENQDKLNEDGELAKLHSWKYSELEKLIQPVTAPNYNLLGDRKESLASMLSARGDRRWTAEVLAGTWEIASGMVSSPRVPQTGKDCGAGSFDSMHFAPVEVDGRRLSMEEAVAELDHRLQSGDEKLRAELDSISTSSGISTRHQRSTTPPMVSAFPIDGADMSLGSIGWRLTLARYISSMILKRYVGTGEGGYPLEKAERLYPYFPNLDHATVRWLCRQLEAWVATQTATGYFGVSEDTIKRSRKLVLKFAQGAKPGLGGHILGPKVTLQVEDMRGVIAGISVFSPFPFHDVYSIEDVTKMIEWLRTVNPDAIICVKISTPVDVYHVALGLVTAGADEIQIDATAGGTGAAPDIARNRIAMPLEFAMADVHKFLVEQGMRNQVILVASGGCRTAYDVAKAFILGADKVILGTQEIVADQCNRCGNCEASGGCQKGITTTVPQLEEQKDIVLNAQWIINAQASVMLHLIKMMHVWGIRDIRELRGRFDLIEKWGWEEPVISNQLSVKSSGQEIRMEEGQLITDDCLPITDKPQKEKYEDREVDACGVVSFACTKPVPVYSIQTACQRMHNRGNGRGGGVLALGGMFPRVNKDKYAMQVNVLCAEEKRQALMAEMAKKYFGALLIFDRNGQPIAQLPDTLEVFRNPRLQKHGRDITWEEAGLAVDPGDIFRFFVRVKPTTLLQFAKDTLASCKGQVASGHPMYLNIAGKWLDYYIKYSDLLTEEFLAGIDASRDFQNDPATRQFWNDLEDEYIYRLAFRLNQEYYIDPQQAKRNPEAYVASMMKDGAIWKLVGYAEQAASYWLVTDAEYRPISDLEKTINEIELPSSSRRSVLGYLTRYRRERKVMEFGTDNEMPQNTFNDVIQDESFYNSRPFFEMKKDSSGMTASFSVANIADDETTRLAPQVKVIHEQGQLTIEIGEAQLIIPRHGERFVMNYQTGAHVWIGHQRFPTVFSPYSGGSHPFYGRINEALIHNGDFANYVAMVRFWDQFGGAPQFRTDTEMAAKAFGILKQMAYPTPHLIEAIAPTTGLDLTRLKQIAPQLAADFEAIQKSQISGSPDGPWFFIIADSIETTNSDDRTLRMLGVTDTSVLRPSVFAWIKSSNTEKWASIGLIGSEEQALRSVLDTLYHRGTLPTKEPDRVTIVRGGSVDVDAAGRPTGGGTIIYSLAPASSDQLSVISYQFDVKDKFGNELFTPGGEHADLALPIVEDEEVIHLKKEIYAGEGELVLASGQVLFGLIRNRLAGWSYNTFRWLVQQAVEIAQDDASRAPMIEGLTLARDQMEAIAVGNKKRSSLIHILQDGLDAIFDDIEKLGTGTLDRNYYRLTRAEYQYLIPPPRKSVISKDENKVTLNTDYCSLVTGHCCLVIDATGFPPEGHDSLARTVVEAYEKGWRKFIVYKQTGQRYLGSGLGPKTDGVEIHLYGNSGQDIANSLMGGTVIVHGDAQNDMSKILHSGTVVVHGLAGNTGLYGAKGGEVFVRKSTGIRWVINSVSSPSSPGLKVFIVGAPMEYLAESLMGGTVVVMGLDWNEKGELVRMLRPFPGNSILAGASAGKVILYDPFNQIEPAQYPGAVEIGFLPADWNEKFAHLQKLVTARFTPAEWISAMDKWKSYIDFTLREPSWTEKSKREAVVDLIEFAKSWCEKSEVQSAKSAIRIPQSAMEMRLKNFVEERFLDREWRRLVRVLAQVFPKNMWAEGIDYLERLRDWKEMRELLEKANHHFGLGLDSDGEEFIFTVDGQRCKLTRRDFKVIRPMTAKEKERDEHERKEAQRELEKKLKENYVASSAPKPHLKRVLGQIFHAPAIA
ncbi:MAG: glutamate synthase-related protein [candidate division KSB1 bacterium]|nr:glutamate synthase-related protein [candidate division KSB1 bacterium]MDZ7368920.1 glutamate synthase-related protein [candidate division KSB1 bacterium]MDZ7406908.1 glutamate synthase-related protein [candidate division KSB1 bacterium]